MGDPVGALAAILPAGAVCVELTEGADRDFTAGLAAEELTAIEDASPGRRREFAAGRECARRALALLGVAPRPLPAGVDGAPVWPQGIVGSITHKGSYRAAAVAHARDLAGLGVDAELDAPLPDGVLETIASPRELDEIERLLAEQPGTHWDRLLFSAKEAVVKAARPLDSGLPGVRSFELRFDPSAATFAASNLANGRTPARGAWRSHEEMLLTTAYAGR